MREIIIKGRYADFTVKPAGGMYDVEVTLTGPTREASAYFTADEVEEIQAALTAALEAPLPEEE